MSTDICGASILFKCSSSSSWFVVQIIWSGPRYGYCWYMKTCTQSLLVVASFLEGRSSNGYDFNDVVISMAQHWILSSRRDQTIELYKVSIISEILLSLFLTVNSNMVLISFTSDFTDFSVSSHSQIRFFIKWIILIICNGSLLNPYSYLRFLELMYMTLHPSRLSH